MIHQGQKRRGGLADFVVTQLLRSVVANANRVTLPPDGVTQLELYIWQAVPPALQCEPSTGRYTGERPTALYIFCLVVELRPIEHLMAAADGLFFLRYQPLSRSL